MCIISIIKGVDAYCKRRVGKETQMDGKIMKTMIVLTIVSAGLAALVAAICILAKKAVD